MFTPLTFSPCRLLKLWDLRKAREKILSTGSSGVESSGGSIEKEEVMQKIEATWDKDTESMHTLLSAVNAAEQKFDAFAGFYQQLLDEDDPSASTAGSETAGKKRPQISDHDAPEPRKVNLDNKELGRVFNYLIRIRKLQKEVDDVIAPPGGPAGESTDSDSGDELSLEELGHTGTGTAGPSGTDSVPTTPPEPSSATASPAVSSDTLSPPPAEDSRSFVPGWYNS